MYLDDPDHTYQADSQFSRGLAVDWRPFADCWERLINRAVLNEATGHESDEAVGLVAVFHDITERKKLETAKSLFITWVAHEIKSPLAVSEGMLKLVLSEDYGLDEPKRRDLVERSLGRINALRLLVSDLTSMTGVGNRQLSHSACHLGHPGGNRGGPGNSRG